MRESKVTVKIPRPLYRKIQQVVDGSGFNSPTDFIVFVLRDLMGDTPATAIPTDAERPAGAGIPADAGIPAEVAVPIEAGADGADFTQEELDDVRRKLENLGYL